MNTFLNNSDPAIAKLINAETRRQMDGLTLIASENLASPAVLEALGSTLTNKYSEGYPGKRFYAGNQFIDEIESLAIERAKSLFGAEHVNVQPHSGSGANMAAYFALLQPGDKILSFDLSHGGHLTHGAKVNFSGKLFNFVHYGVKPETEQLDYDEILAIAKREMPKLIVAGATAYSRTIDFESFRKIADEVGAKLLVDMAHIAGLVAAKLHPSPIPYADVVTTTTHKTLRGPRGAMILCKSEYAKAIDSAVFPGIQGGPLEHAIAAKAVAFHEAASTDFVEYQRQTIANAQELAATLAHANLWIVSGGTDNHLVLVNLSKVGLTGKDAENLLEQAGIYVNKNLIPFDTRKALDPSGLRLGTPCLTTRGMKEPEMKLIGNWIADLLHKRATPEQIGKLVLDLAGSFPFYTL